MLFTSDCQFNHSLPLSALLARVASASAQSLHPLQLDHHSISLLKIPKEIAGSTAQKIGPCRDGPMVAQGLGQSWPDEVLPLAQPSQNKQFRPQSLTSETGSEIE
jgi:hypothetical protein